MHAGRARQSSLRWLRPGCIALILLIAPMLFCAQSSPRSPRLSEDEAEALTAGAPMLEEMQEAPAPIPASSPSPTGDTATVHGIVINAATGEPLPRALVHLTSGKPLGALTDGEGRFSIAGVPTGAQTFDVEKPGFGGVVAMTDYTLPTSHTVRVAAEMPDLRFSISPQNAIYGQVTLSSGDPAVGISLTLFKQIVQAGHSAWNDMQHRQTTPEGQFRFPGLDDGTYLLMTQPSFDNDKAESSTCDPKSPAAVSGYPATFSGGATDFAGAAHITVSGGQQSRTNFSLALAEFHDVQIKFAKPPGSLPWQIVSSLADSDGSSLEYPVQRDEKAHAFCAYLPDGAYILTVNASTACGPGNAVRCAVRGPDRSHDLEGMIAFSVEGRPLRGLQVPLAEGASTPVHVRYQPEPPPQASANAPDDDSEGDPLSVAAVSVTGAGSQSDNFGVATSTGADTYELSRLRPGRYWIGASTDRKGTCLGPVTSGGQNLAHVPWNAGPAGTGQEIDVVVRTDCAKLTVQLPPGIDSTSSGEDLGLNFYVIPAFDFSGELREGHLQVSGSTSVDLDDMTPGTYRVFAFASPRAIEFQNPGAMDRLAGKGQEVTLEPGGSATLVVEVPAP